MFYCRFLLQTRSKVTPDTVTNDAAAGVSWLGAGCRGGFYILQDGHVPGSLRGEEQETEQGTSSHPFRVSL